MFPNLQLLEKIQGRIKFIPNHRKESKSKEHYSLFLLCYGAGLRVSEAISFDLNNRAKKCLYSVKSKGNKERLVVIPKSVIKELKKIKWKPNQTNRFNFYHFLKRVKRELAISKAIELTPHTLRRAFATYYAENGLPLPLLQKLLGHSSIRTTALYWINIYGNDGDDSNDILIAKNWPQKPKNPPIESSSPIRENLEPLLELVPKPPACEQHFDYSTKISQLENQLNQVQTENNNLKAELSQAKEQNTDLQQDLNNLSQQNTILHQQKNHTITEKEKSQQELSIAKKTIAKLEQELAQEKNQRITAQNNLIQANQTNTKLHQELQTEKETNANLTTKLDQQEQNQTNLQIAYQNTLKDKQEIQNQLNYYENQLKAITLMLHQWQKLNSYQKLEKPNQFEPSQNNNNQLLETQIIQPPPWK